MSSSKMLTAGENRGDNSEPNSKADDNDNATQGDYWLQVARDAYSGSSQYFDANIRKNIERNMAHFSGRHAPGSKYYSSSYQHRHKGFRNKTRAMITKKEAAAAVALFSTSDVVHITAERSSDKAHQVSAEINQELLQYRLDNTIKWFQIAMGAYQETMVSGVVVSHQYWDYQESVDRVPQLNEDGTPQLDDEGEPLFTEEYITIKDTCTTELRPIENVLFSISADWTDPINTSPFLIDKIPMTIDDIKLMANPSRTSKIPWFDLSDEQLTVGITTDQDAIRSAREGQREDSKDQRYATTGFDVAWVHRNIVRQDGRDWVFYTLGIHQRLSDPIPLEEEYPWLKMGERPYVLGVSNIEAHKNYPDSVTGLSAGTQQEANEINNQRRDNVALVLNRRYIVKKNANVDYASLQRNVPGGITETDDPRNDIKIEAPPDVTASSYQEQDRINMDFDELTGHFSTSSVGSNRGLNETVGGMNLLSSSADALTEYPLRIFVETWVKPVLKQLIRLEQRHESNEALLALIGEKMNVWQRFGIDRITDAWIQGSMNIQVNVGFGSTNPQQRINKLSTGLNTILQFVPQMAGRLDGEEVAKEVLGALGYNGIERFFPVQDEAEQAPADQPPPSEPLSDYDRAKLDQDYQIHQDKLEEGNMIRQHTLQLQYMKQEESLIKLADDKQITMEQLKVEREKLAVDRQNKVDEFNVKLQTGSGI